MVKTIVLYGHCEVTLSSIIVETPEAVTTLLIRIRNHSGDGNEAFGIGPLSGGDNVAFGVGSLSGGGNVVFDIGPSLVVAM